MQPDVNAFSEFCAPGVQVKEEMIAVAKNVSLRVITFSPPTRNHNPGIVFVPGWISLIRSWKEVLVEMTRDFPVYYIETREKITSKVFGDPGFGVEAVGRDLAAIISHLNLKRQQYVLLGSSLGATAILDCCRTLEPRPLCLVLVAPNAVFRIPKSWMIIVRTFNPRWYRLIKPAVKWYLRTFRMDVRSDSAQYDKYCAALDAADPRKLKQAVLDLAEYEVWGYLQDHSDPTLIIGASKDRLHEPENLRKMVSMMKQASYLDLETNTATHSAYAAQKIREYIAHLQNTSIA